MTAKVMDLIENDDVHTSAASARVRTALSALQCERFLNHVA